MDLEGQDNDYKLIWLANRWSWIAVFEILMNGSSVWNLDWRMLTRTILIIDFYVVIILVQFSIHTLTSFDDFWLQVISIICCCCIWTNLHWTCFAVPAVWSKPKLPCELRSCKTVQREQAGVQPQSPRDCGAELDSRLVQEDAHRARKGTIRNRDNKKTSLCFWFARPVETLKNSSDCF